MAENGRVHPNCVNASNPYHECGVACLEKIAEGKGKKDKDKKKIDNHSGIKEGELSKKVVGERKVHQACTKASNPYHECDELCYKRITEANARGAKKESDNHSGIKEGEPGKKVVGERKVHPACTKASNPYHECNELCHKRITEANAQGDKKESDNHSGIKEGEISKKVVGERKVHPACTKASNPYHECDELCYKRITEANARGGKKESGSKIFDVSGSFGRKKKASESQPKPPQAPNNGHVVSAAYPAGAQSPSSLLSPRKKVESEISESSSSERHSEEIYSQDHSFNTAQVRSVQSVRTSGNVTPNRSKHPSKDSVTTPTKQVEDLGNGTNSPVVGSMNFSFSGIVRALDESDDDEVQSVISDSCVSVGKYHVRASVSSILQSIIDKYGDIAADCQLESVSMRAYYLECLCSVVQELQSTPITQLSKSKVREMLAVLKDVESAQIDVSWLRSILNDVFETIDFISQHQTIESAKANCDRVLESTRKELEFQMEDLAQKEEAVAEAKARVAETKSRLSELELECSRLDKTILSGRSKVEKFEGKSSADGLL